MCVSGGHEVNDRNDLLWQRERIVLAEPHLRLELLRLRCLIDRPAYATAVEVEVGIEILLWSDAAGVARDGEQLLTEKIFKV